MKKVVSFSLAFLLIFAGLLNVLAAGPETGTFDVEMNEEERIAIANTVESIVEMVDEREESLISSGAEDVDFVTREEFARLSIEDIESIYNAMIELMSGGADAQEIEASVIEQIKELSNANSIVPYGSSGMNSQELALCAAFPSHGVVYVTQSNTARTKAEAIYTQNSTWYSGNGDAYRHIYWNVLLYKSFLGMYGFDSWYSSAKEKTETFTAAHEYGVPQDIHRQMDELNNAKGLICAEAWNQDSAEQIAVYTENYIDMGFAYRVKAYNGVDAIVPTDNSEKR